MPPRFTSVIVSPALTCLLVAASQSAAARIHDRPTGDRPAGVLLLSSRPIEQQVDENIRCNVQRRLASLPVGPSATVISANELDGLRDHHAAGQQFDKQLDEVELEVRAPRGLPEPPVEATIPFGLAGLAWGVRHPSEAWRLILPVLVV